jgi:hypothetical protein
MTKTDLPYNTAGYLGPACDWWKLFEKLCRKKVCHTILLVTWHLLVAGEIIRKVMTKTDLPYNNAGYLGPAGVWGKLFEKLWRKQICHTSKILLVTWDLLVAGEIIRKVMTKKDLPHNTASYLGPAIWPVWRVSRFSTICAKIHMLNLIIDKVTVWITF